MQKHILYHFYFWKTHHGLEHCFRINSILCCLGAARAAEPTVRPGPFPGSCSPKQGRRRDQAPRHPPTREPGTPNKQRAQKGRKRPERVLEPCEKNGAPWTKKVYVHKLFSRRKTCLEENFIHVLFQVPKKTLCT